MVHLSALSPLIGLFMVTGAWHLREGVHRAGPRGVATETMVRRLVDSFFHVLMSAAMLAMLWPGLSGVGGPALAAVQTGVFGGGVMWFLMTTDAVRPRWLDAASMAAMVWMLIVMGHAAGGGSRPLPMPGTRATTCRPSGPQAGLPRSPSGSSECSPWEPPPASDAGDRTPRMRSSAGPADWSER